MTKLCPIRGNGQSPCIQDECAWWSEERRISIAGYKPIVFPGRCCLATNVTDRVISGALCDEADDLAVDIRKALEAFPVPGGGSQAFYLTPSEISVFRLVGYGLTNEEVADTLCISPLTIRTHIKRIHAKCDIVGRSRLAIVSRYIWQGERTPSAPADVKSK